jgi:hypothetical protein
MTLGYPSGPQEATARTPSATVVPPRVLLSREIPEPPDNRRALDCPIHITQFWILRQQLDHHVSTTMGYTGLDNSDSIAFEKCARRWVWLCGNSLGVGAGIFAAVEPASETGFIIELQTPALIRWVSSV